MQMLRQRVAAVEALAAVSSKGPFFPSEREVLANALRPSASTHSKGILSDLFPPFPSEPSSLGNALVASSRRRRRAHANSKALTRSSVRDVETYGARVASPC